MASSMVISGIVSASAACGGLWCRGGRSAGFVAPREFTDRLLVRGRRERARNLRCSSSSTSARRAGRLLREPSRHCRRIQLGAAPERSLGPLKRAEIRDLPHGFDARSGRHHFLFRPAPFGFDGVAAVAIDALLGHLGAAARETLRRISDRRPTRARCARRFRISSSASQSLCSVR